MSSGKVILALDNTTTKLEAFLSDTGTPVVTVIYHIIPAQVKSDTSEYKRARTRAALAGTTPTTILAAPVAAGDVIHIDAFYLNNSTGATRTVTVQLDDGTNNDILVEQELLDTETLSFDSEEGFRVM